MAIRTHDRIHFYKYMSAETARRVIETKCFRWSSPVKFNDPFDHQAGFILNYKPDEFAELLTSSFKRIIFSDVTPIIQPVSLLSALTLKLRSIRHKLPRDKILRELHESSIESSKNLHEHIEKFNYTIHNQLLHSRVFCVSEHHDNVVMWSHYGEEHTGLVFKLRCIDELDNALLAARRVSYTNKFVSFPNAEQYAKHLTCEQRIDFAVLCWNIAFTKHIDWSYEKEWRVHRPLLNEAPGNGYSVYSEDPRVFETVYLGCRMPKNEVTEITKLVRKHLPNTRIFRGEKSTTRFALIFREI